MPETGSVRFDAGCGTHVLRFLSDEEPAALSLAMDLHVDWIKAAPGLRGGNDMHYMVQASLAPHPYGCLPPSRIRGLRPHAHLLGHGEAPELAALLVMHCLTRGDSPLKIV